MFAWHLLWHPQIPLDFRTVFFFPKSRVWWLLGLKVPGRLTFLWEGALSHLVLHRLQVTKGCHEVSSRACHAFDVLYSFRTRACPHQAGPVIGETWRKVRGEKSWTHHSLLSNCPDLDEGVMGVLFHGVIQIMINHGPSKHGLLWELQMAVALFGWQLKKQLASFSMRTPMNYQWVLGPLESILVSDNSHDSRTGSGLEP